MISIRGQCGGEPIPIWLSEHLHVPINYVVLLIMYNNIKIIIIVPLVVRLALGGNVEVSLYQSDYQSTYNVHVPIYY